MKKLLSSALALALGATLTTPAPDMRPAQIVATAQAAAVVRADAAPPLVAVIDSGVAHTPELAGILIGEYDMAARPPRTAFKPRYAHGTMVATILKREAKQPIEIVSMRIDDPAGCPVGQAPPCQPDGEPIARAIRKATELGATAINISLSLKDDPDIVAAVREAGARGVSVVMAAGNEGRSYPSNLAAARAAYPCAIIVGALDGTGQPWKGSNRPVGSPTDYLFDWQPGVSVPTVLDDGTEILATGTSMATPVETARLLDETPEPIGASSERSECRLRARHLRLPGGERPAYRSVHADPAGPAPAAQSGSIAAGRPGGLPDSD